MDWKFNDLFDDIPTPVLVYRADETLAVVYQNRNARLLLNPLTKGDVWEDVHVSLPVHEVCRISTKEMDEITDLLSKNTQFSNHVVTMSLYNGDQMPTSICGRKIRVGAEQFVVLYIYTANSSGNLVVSDALATAINLAYTAKTTDEAINHVLAFAGSHTGVSRTYIFESISEAYTSNTYEWCAAGVEPAIEQLQKLPKDAYSYDAIIAAGMAVTDDIRLLSKEDRAVLEPQGIKSLAVIPIFAVNRPLGYIGFDDCNSYRKWSQVEIHLLRDLSELIASLLMRRDTERGLSYSLDILRTVTDSSDDIVYVNDITNFQLLFVNKPLREALKLPEGLENNLKCWETLQKDMEEQCHFCPLRHMLDSEGNIVEDNYTWQFQNTITGKWYIVRDAIIKWTDGRMVHIETATDISMQKEYEAKLEHFASIDTMTEIYNREWGSRIIKGILAEKNQKQSACLVFIDINGLKRINDTFGHSSGDQVIQKIAQILKSNIRKSDMLCRWGGDEFIVILRANKEQSERIMKKILDAIAVQNDKKEYEFELSFSYGLVELQSGSGASLDTIISEADRKMYTNKLSYYDNKQRQ